MNTLCHVEYFVTNLDRSQAFYEGVFGWTFREFMGGTMRVFGVGDTHIGGLMLRESVTPSDTPSLWFKVESLDDSCAKSVQLGGSIVGERSEVPGVGWSIQVKDPDGNLVGLVQYN
ncbi:MAG: VOC family protein [Fimbriimonadaceae bacterium]|nr:VOC family protein [Fimbriimonadaceae bacterium]